MAYFSSSVNAVIHREDEITELEGKPYRFMPSQETLHHELEAIGFAIKRSDLQHGREEDQYGHCMVHLTRNS